MTLVGLLTKMSKYVKSAYFVAKTWINCPLWVDHQLLQFNFWSAWEGGIRPIYGQWVSPSTYHICPAPPIRAVVGPFSSISSAVVSTPLLISVLSAPIDMVWDQCVSRIGVSKQRPLLCWETVEEQDLYLTRPLCWTVSAKSPSLYFLLVNQINNFTALAQDRHRRLEDTLLSLAKWGFQAECLRQYLDWCSQGFADRKFTCEITVKLDSFVCPNSVSKSKYH